MDLQWMQTDEYCPSNDYYEIENSSNLAIFSSELIEKAQNDDNNEMYQLDNQDKTSEINNITNKKSESKKTNSHKRKYREVSEETKQKISKSLKGITRSEETRQAISKGMRDYWKNVPSCDADNEDEEFVSIEDENICTTNTDDIKKKSYAIDKYRSNLEKIGFDTKEGAMLYDKRNKQTYYYAGLIGKKYDIKLGNEGLFPVLPIFDRDKRDNTFKISNQFNSIDDEIILLDNNNSIYKYKVGNVRRSITQKLNKNELNRMGQMLTASINPSTCQNSDRLNSIISMVNNMYGFNLNTGMFVISDKGNGKGSYSISFAKKKEEVLNESLLLI